MSSRHVHDLVAHVEEHLASEWLRKEVGDVVRGGHEGHAKFAVFNAFANEIVASFDVLGLRMVLRVLRDATGAPGEARALPVRPVWACAGSFKVHLGSTRVGAVGRAVSEGVRA